MSSQRREREQTPHRRHGPGIVLIKMKTKEETQKPRGLRENLQGRQLLDLPNPQAPHWEMLPKRPGGGARSSCPLRIRG